VTVGTPHYLSPEAVESPEKVTPQSDVYAIGAVVYYLVTGEQLFKGKTVMEICMKHVRNVPESPSARLGRPVTPGLEGLILRCLAKKPEERPQGTRALADELDRLEVAGSWTRAEAEAWWDSNRKGHPDRGESVSAAATTKVGHPHRDGGFL
jgi:serine/threonine protein kinase